MVIKSGLLPKYIQPLKLNLGCLAKPDPTAEAKSFVRRLEFVVCGEGLPEILLLTWKVIAHRGAPSFDTP